VGSYGSSVEGGRFGTTDTDASAIGVQFNLPIYSGGIVQSRTREAEHKREVALQSAEEQRRAAIKAARNAYSGIITGISRVKALDQAVISAETALNATQAGFEVGTRTAVDVVTQVRELLRAKRDRARARYDYILNTLRLKEAAGRLIPEDLVAVNSWLESEH
jgi:outer membrane protein